MLSGKGKIRNKKHKPRIFEDVELVEVGVSQRLGPLLVVGVFGAGNVTTGTIGLFGVDGEDTLELLDKFKLALDRYVVPVGVDSF
jgi:hypothetical protein